MLKRQSALRRDALGTVCALLLCLGATPLAAQGVGSLGGTLLSRTSREPIEGARMTVLGTALVTSTDSAGRFEFLGVPAGVRVIQARAVGYAIASWVVQLAAGQAFQQELEMEGHAVEVPGVTVTGARRDDWRSEAGFEERRRRESGFFITREDIANRSARTIVDLLRTVPGVSAVCRYQDNCQVRMNRSTRQCMPEYFLDGFPATLSTGPTFPINQIRGVEVYRSEFEAPFEFQRAGLRCGVIAIWTVEPGERLDRPRQPSARETAPPAPRPPAPGPAGAR